VIYLTLFYTVNIWL